MATGVIVADTVKRLHIPFFLVDASEFNMHTSTNVFDVAAYILSKTGVITHMKLQKLIYYSQAWALVWDDAPLFPERIEAWINGPVSPDLFQELKGQFSIGPSSVDSKGDAKKLSDEQRQTIDGVVEHYGTHNSQYLSDLSHLEDPWRNARNGIPDSIRGSQEIIHASMSEYYSSL